MNKKVRAGKEGKYNGFPTNLTKPRMAAKPSFKAKPKKMLGKG
jgi:hypothetical protein